MNEEYITLKWGGLKSWNLNSDKAIALLQEYFSDGIPMSAMMDHPTEKRKEILCKLIDECAAETIYLDWDDKDVTKQEAKNYVLNYGK